MSMASYMIDKLVESESQPFVEGAANDQLVMLLWKKLPSNLRSKVDIKKFSDSLQGLESGEEMSSLAKRLKLSPSVASELLIALGKSGLV